MRALWIVGVSVSIAGCFTPPVGIRAAEQALSAAEAVGAQEYLPIEYETSRDLLVIARQELALQETESITHRSYRRANRLLAAAEESAVKLRDRAAKRKEEVRALIIPEIQMLMVWAELLEEAGSEEIERVDAAMRDAGSAYRGGRYIDALIMIRDAQSAADEALELDRRRVEPGA